MVFYLPTHWKEEYEPLGGATFYEACLDSGTLRLNVLSFENNKGKSAEDMVATVFAPEEREILANGLTMRRIMKTAEENGEILHIHRWEVAVPIPPNGINIVVFAHTLVAGQESEPARAAELEFIDWSVRHAEFARGKGESGPYYHSV